MTAPHATALTPAAGAIWPGRPTLDVPGLEQPATFCAGALSDDEYGHRAVLVIGSEDGTMVTTAQLVKLAEALDSMYGGEAPEGSRAWLAAKARQWQEAATRLNSQCVAARQRAETAEAALRDRSQLDAGGAERERLSLELSRIREARDAQAARAVELYDERQQLETRVDELTAMLDQTRHERDVLRQRTEDAENDANRYATAITRLEAERDAARATVLELGPPAAALREEVEQLRRQRRVYGDEVMHARNQVHAEQAEADRLRARLRIVRRDAATQRARADRAVSGATWAALTATAAGAAALWRRSR